MAHFMIPARACLPPLFLVSALITGLAACSGGKQYPSLAYRPVERVTPVTPATPPAIELPPPSADLTTRINGLVSAAREADSRFNTRRPAAERAVAAASGAAATSNAWIAAQVAVSDLEASRDPAVGALADLDTLYADARQGEPVEESPSTQSISSARNTVQDIVAAQDVIVAGLHERMGS